VAKASHRLNLRLLPPQTQDSLGDGVDRLVAAGYLRPGGAGFVPGPRPLLEGSFPLALALQDPAPRFYSPGQGGFRVACPDCKNNLVPSFSLALTRQESDVLCSCGRRHPLHTLDFQPPCAFACACLELRDVQESSLFPEPRRLLEQSWGGLRVLLHRG
jgi:hypothetical protein